MVGDSTRALPNTFRVACILHCLTTGVWAADYRLPAANFSGGSIPLLGFGAASPLPMTYVVALDLGYRHIDTAFSHRNHEAIREALKNTSVPREEIFLTTKVSGVLSSYNAFSGRFQLTKLLTDPEALDPKAGGGTYAKGRELEGLNKALQELGTDYLDLCLVHRPGVTALEMHASYVPHLKMLRIVGPRLKWLLQHFVNNLAFIERLFNWELVKKKRADVWQQMEEAKRRGLCKHIGVSNYPLGALKEMESYATEMPQVLQIEHTPLCQQKEVLKYAAAKNIAVTGYGTLSVLHDPLVHVKVEGIARRVQRTPNQVLLRWRLQSGVGLLQGAFNPGHMLDNVRVLDFELSPADMANLDSLNQEDPLYFDLTWFDRPWDSVAVMCGLLLIGISLCVGCCRGCYRCCRVKPAPGKEKKNS